MVGCFATSKAGHDKQKLYVILEASGEYVYLCDGKTKTTDKPKKKSMKHIQVINRKVNKELLQKLESGEKIFDTEIKYAIKHFRYEQDM